MSTYLGNPFFLAQLITFLLSPTLPVKVLFHVIDEISEFAVLNSRNPLVGAAIVTTNLCCSGCH